MSATSDPAAVLTSNQVPRGATQEALASTGSSNLPTQQDFVNIFGPAGADVKLDKNRFGRMNRVHIPDVLRGPNQWMTDRIDGLITDTTNSPYTTLILPYKYIETPDAKFKWNVWSFDEGLASRVPYESAARTLTQSKREFAGFTVRQGLAITMEHNFMMTPEGRQNFQNQLKQIVGSIQYSNDLDVHMALVNAPSYFAQVREKYYRDEHNVEREIREYVDNFGFLQKNVNGLDILIEDAKTILRGWGSDEPDFLLLNSKLTFQITMLPEKTQYITQGIDGVKRLRDGPNITKYRGLNIIRSKAFSMEQGAAPRDLLRRRVRVAEFYLLKFGDTTENTTFDLSATIGEESPVISDSSKDTDEVGELSLYDESCDSWCPISFKKLYEQCRKFINKSNRDQQEGTGFNENFKSMLVIRPNIEHWMLGIILGKGGIDELGATLWGQTELSCFDDGQHGIWGMSYKYHEKAIVFNERNLIRIWDVAYDGYVGGKDCSILNWSSDKDITRFIQADGDLNRPYDGPSIVVIPLPEITSLPSPLPLTNLSNDAYTQQPQNLLTPDMYCEDMSTMIQKLNDKIGEDKKEVFNKSISRMYELLNMNRNNSMSKDACSATIENEATAIRFAYSGTYKYKITQNNITRDVEISGSGHHGPDYVGVASLRAGKGYRVVSQPVGTRMM